MANTCENIVAIDFEGESAMENKKAFYEEFKEEFEVRSEWGLDDDEANCLELTFDSSWNTPEDRIKYYAEKYKCLFTGVSFEFGCRYVNSFAIGNLEETNSVEE